MSNNPITPYRKIRIGVWAPRLVLEGASMVVKGREIEYHIYYAKNSNMGHLGWVHVIGNASKVDSHHVARILTECDCGYQIRCDSHQA